MWWCSARQKHEIPGISFRQTGNWTPEDEIFGINCRNVAPEQRKCFPREKRNFIPSKRTFSTVRDHLNWDLVNQTVEIYLNNELINKDIKHNLLTNLIICVNMQKEISKAEYLAGRQHSPCEYFSEIMGGKLMYFKIEKFYYHSKISEYVQSMTKIKQWLINQNREFENYIESLISSELNYHSLDYIQIQTAKRIKTRAGSYIKTPIVIEKNKGIVNIKNKSDNLCILWCLLAHKYYHTITHNKKSEVSTYKKYFDEIIQPEDIKYPIDIQNDIPKFEKLNNIKINVFIYNGSYEEDYDRNKITILYNNMDRNENTINLLLLEDENKHHFVWIKDLSKLICMNTHKHKKRNWCCQCLNFSHESEDKLNEHMKLCMNNEAVKTILPEKNKEDWNGNREDIIKLKNFGNTFAHPFSVFLDLENQE